MEQKFYTNKIIVFLLHVQNSHIFYINICLYVCGDIYKKLFNFTYDLGIINLMKLMAKRPQQLRLATATSLLALLLLVLLLLLF